MPITPELALEMYRRMCLIREFEQRVQALFARGLIPGAVHLSIGQEAAVVGACMAVRADDTMVGHHRSHGHPLGKGAAPGPLFAELLGKATGVNAGKGGSMHLADFAVGSLGESSIVGSGLPLAVGAALGARMQGQDRVCLCFFGDGATAEGYFHEALNMAALWRVPAVFVCENNGYGVTTSIARAGAQPDIAARAAAYAMPGTAVDGQDVLAVHAAVTQAAARARAGEGPSLIEARTYRYAHHSEGPLYDAIPYRTAEEIERWRARDPLALARARFIADGLADAAALDGAQAQAADQAAQAERFAQESPLPDADALWAGLYVENAGA